jgi:hypothetical protein
VDFAGPVNTIRATRLPGGQIKNEGTNSSQNVPSAARVAAGAFGFLIFSHTLEVSEELQFDTHSAKAISGPIIQQRTKKYRCINGGIDDRETWEWDVKELQDLPQPYVKEMQHLPQPFAFVRAR